MRLATRNPRKPDGWLSPTRMLAFLVAGAMLLAGGLAAPVAMGQGADDPRAVVELAERMLDYGTAGDESRARLLPGRLPADFPFDLPVPAGGRLIGSVARESGGWTTSVSVIIDVRGTVWEVHRFYEAALAERGWTTPSSASFGAGGFQQSFGLMGMFCRGDDAYLSEQVRERGNGMAEIRLSVQTVPMSAGGRQYNPCSPQMTSGYPYSSQKELLPPLTPPTGARLMATSQAFGSSGEMRGSDAVIRTEMAPADLEAHLAQQLRAADWTRRTGGGDGASVWSTWALPVDGEWQGFLIVQETQWPDRRFVSLRSISGAMEGPGITGVPFMYMGP